MRLEVHDTEPGNTLTATVNHLDYDYMAEQWVQDIMKDESRGEKHSKHPLDKFVLIDDFGVRATWKVSNNDKGEPEVSLVEKSDRFTGQWQMGIPFNPLHR